VFSRSYHCVNPKKSRVHYKVSHCSLPIMCAWLSSADSERRVILSPILKRFVGDPAACTGSNRQLPGAVVSSFRVTVRVVRIKRATNRVRTEGNHAITRFGLYRTKISRRECSTVGAVPGAEQRFASVEICNIRDQLILLSPFQGLQNFKGEDK